MRQKRSKTYRKLLSSYILHFGYHPPFQVLVDAPFALSLSALHMSAPEADKRLSDVLQTSQMTKGKRKGAIEQPDMKCMITQCCMVELYTAEKDGKLQKDAVQLAKAWERRKCNHREAIEGDECLKSVVGPTNKHRYMVASDSRTLRSHLRDKVAGIPLVHTNQSRVIVLEPVSDKTKAKIREIETSKLEGNANGSLASRPLGGNVIVDGGEASYSAPKPIVRGGNRPKAPNPLSNKKPKKVLEQERLEKEKRTRDIQERTEANRVKKRKTEESVAAMPATTNVLGGLMEQTSLGAVGEHKTHRRKRRKRGGKRSRGGKGGAGNGSGQDDNES